MSGRHFVGQSTSSARIHAAGLPDGVWKSTIGPFAASAEPTPSRYPNCDLPVYGAASQVNTPSADSLTPSRGLAVH